MLRQFRLTVDCSLLTLLGGCSVTPLTNKISVGEEPFVLAIGEGPDGMTDLYAAPAHGGEISGLLESIVQRRFDFETDSALAIDKTCIDHKQQVQ